MENLKYLLGTFVKLQGKKNVILMRHTESIGNYSGTICGWTDAKLTINGKFKNLLFQIINLHLGRE